MKKIYCYCAFKSESLERYSNGSKTMVKITFYYVVVVQGVCFKQVASCVTDCPLSGLCFRKVTDPCYRSTRCCRLVANMKKNFCFFFLFLKVKCHLALTLDIVAVEHIFSLKKKKVVRKTNLQ